MSGSSNLADLPPHTDISWSRMAIGRSTPLVLTSSGQEWQFHIATVAAYIGRSTGRYTPHQSSTDALSTVTPTWQIYLPSIEHRCLEYCYTKLGRSYIGRSTGRYTPLAIKHRCLEYCYTKHGRFTGRSIPLN